MNFYLKQVKIKINPPFVRTQGVSIINGKVTSPSAMKDNVLNSFLANGTGTTVRKRLPLLELFRK